MQCTEGRVGRVFVLRLEHGEPMPETLERFAAEKGVKAGVAVMVGGVDEGSRIVVGPRDATTMPPDPMLRVLAGVHEVAGVGVIVPDENGAPRLHMHAALGREDHTLTGCIRPGIAAWEVLEIVLLELVGVDAVRLPDETTGFSLLQCRNHYA